MRPDHYIGAVIAFGLLSGLASIGRNPAVHLITTVTKPIEEPPFVEIKNLPDPAEEPSTGAAGEKSTARDDIRPPKLPDTIGPLFEGAFPTPVQPPVPEGAKITPGIPVLPPGGENGNGGSGRIFDLGALDQQPVARVQQKPTYPFEKRRNGESGEVIVDFIVDATGDVRNAYAVRSTDRAFEAAAVQAVSKWKFKPGKKAGAFVGTHVVVPIVFTLGDGAE